MNTILKDYSGSRQPEFQKIGNAWRYNFNHEVISATEESTEQFVCNFVPQYWQEEVKVEYPTIEDFKTLLYEHQTTTIA